MKCSFVISAFNRPGHLKCLLASLAIQTEPDFNALIMDNSPDNLNAAVVDEMSDPRFLHVHSSEKHCYASSNLGASLARGDYLCFPSDDDYYVPLFLELMLKQETDLIYCNMLYDPKCALKEYGMIDVRPKIGKIDKGGFLVRRTKFIPFPWEQSLILADGMMVEKLIANQLSHSKANGILWVHN